MCPGTWPGVLPSSLCERWVCLGFVLSGTGSGECLGLWVWQWVSVEVRRRPGDVLRLILRLGDF